MRIALTGATGGVGRAVCEKFLEEGRDVSALVRTPAAAGWLAAKGARLVRGDLDAKEALADLVRGADVVVHCAAHVGDWGTREEFERVNVGGTRNMVEAAAAAKVPRFVHVSSVAVYGRPKTGTIREEYGRHRMGTPYEDTKIGAEEVAFGRGSELGLEVTAVRPPVVFGEHDKVFLPRVVAQLRKRMALLIDGGEGLFNMVDVRDVVDVVSRLLTHEKAPGEVFNVAAVPPCIRDVFDAIADGAGAPRSRFSVPRPVAMLLARALDRGWKLAKAGGPPPLTPFVVTMVTLKVTYDATKAQRLLGWPAPSSPLERLRELARTYR